MINKYFIIVEGIADIIFLRDYLIFLDPSLLVKTDKIKSELQLESEDRIIKIKKIGGYTNILQEKTTITQFLDEKFNILVIQDADDPTKSHGGIDDRMKYLDEIKENLEIKFMTFLFPNNQDNGDLEALLLQIKKENKYEKVNECYENYINCVDKIPIQTFTEELKENKSRIFNYFSTYYGMENAKEQNRKYEADYWDFNNDALKPLKMFLSY